jgi:hypothetical protein
MRSTEEDTMDTHPQISQERRDYLSYLLRLWRESDGEVPAWRASLKSSHTGETVGFANLEELCEFLRRKTRRFQDTEGPGQET